MGSGGLVASTKPPVDAGYVYIRFNGDTWEKALVNVPGCRGRPPARIVLPEYWRGSSGQQDTLPWTPASHTTDSVPATLPTDPDDLASHILPIRSSARSRSPRR